MSVLLALRILTTLVLAIGTLLTGVFLTVAFIDAIRLLITYGHLPDGKESLYMPLLLVLTWFLAKWTRASWLAWIRLWRTQ